MIRSLLKQNPDYRKEIYVPSLFFKFSLFFISPRPDFLKICEKKIPVQTKSTAFLRRYNTLATNAQTLNVNLSQHVLYRSKAEILHVLEALISLDTAAAEIKVFH
jgi:hypothetical protein